MINPEYSNLRSPEQIMDADRGKHPELLTRIHNMIANAETLANKIADEQPGCSAVGNSFQDLADAISDLRADYLAPADKDLKDWYESWQPYGE